MQFYGTYPVCPSSSRGLECTSVNCWNPLRAASTTTQPVKANVKVGKDRGLGNQQPSIPNGMKVQRLGRRPVALKRARSAERTGDASSRYSLDCMETCRVIAEAAMTQGVDDSFREGGPVGVCVLWRLSLKDGGRPAFFCEVSASATSEPHKRS